MNAPRRHFVSKCMAVAALAVGALVVAGCPAPSDSGTPDAGDSNANAPSAPSGSDNTGSGQAAASAWFKAFDVSKTGALSSAWGSSLSDVFVVGGKPAQGEIYHYDGSHWRAMDVPPAPLLVWVFGFSSTDVYAVGTGGGVVHYDGATWSALNSGTTEDLWGVWGRSPSDMWIVGGNVGAGEPVLLHFDGSVFTPVAIPANDRAATSLFKVWGIGSKVIAVGENGLIIENDGAGWRYVAAGANADEDFVSLWGTSADNIVVVGGRSSARIATYDGTGWSTIKPTGVPGLNGVCSLSPTEAIVGGDNGYVGRFDPSSGTLVAETSGTHSSIHAVWGIGSTYYAVGGLFASPFTGLALVRTQSEPASSTDAPQPASASDNTQQDAPITDCNNNGVDDADDIAAGAGDCDGNGVPDVCDADIDGDGVPDACDACPGSDDSLDSDNDSVPDGCDVCPMGDDTLDTDHDGVPNACDDCTGDNASDADGDGVPDACDVCPGFDDTDDPDHDGIPSACDPCPNDASPDSDGDGVCDSVDVCPGFDDAIDTDGDGTPDGCDPTPGTACTKQSTCPVGEDCVNGLCEPVSGPDLELGTGGGQSGKAYHAIDDGDMLTVYQGTQGLAHMFVTMRMTGFAADAVVDVSYSVVRVDNGVAIIAPSAIPFGVDPEGATGIVRIADLRLITFSNLAEIDGTSAVVHITIADSNDNAITITKDVTVVLVVEYLGP